MSPSGADFTCAHIINLKEANFKGKGAFCLMKAISRQKLYLGHAMVISC